MITKQLFKTIQILVLFFSCQTPDIQHIKSRAEDIHETTHFNLIFAPDLSNRVNPNLHRRALKDPDILSIITHNLYPSIIRHRRTENQIDKFRIDFINKGQINLFRVNSEKLLLDFGKFRNQADRIAYILGRNGVTETLKKDTTQMNAEFCRIYNQANQMQSGADVWNYLHQGIDDYKILGQEKIVSAHNTYINNFRNILILTTDGYIEAGIFNKGFDLSQHTINRFRDSYKASGEKDIAAYFKKNLQFRIKPVNNPNLRNLEILVMELYDRSLTPAGMPTVQPTDLEIIKLFWTDWLQHSNVKRFELRSCAGSEYDAEKIILDFLGIKAR
jgi:hypothetical protein